MSQRFQDEPVDSGSAGPRHRPRIGRRRPTARNAVGWIDEAGAQPPIDGGPVDSGSAGPPATVAGLVGAL